MCRNILLVLNKHGSRHSTDNRARQEIENQTSATSTTERKVVQFNPSCILIRTPQKLCMSGKKRYPPVVEILINLFLTTFFFLVYSNFNTIVYTICDREYAKI